MKIRPFLFLSLLLIILAGCKVKEERLSVVPDLFKSAALQDSLARFVSCIDSVPNPYGAPTTIVVTLSEAEDGYDVVFLATAGLNKSLPDASFIGGSTLAGKPAGFYCTVPSAASLVKEGALDTVFPASTEFIKYYDPSVKWIGWHPQSRRTYHLSGNGSLEQTSVQMGNFERYRRQHFGWPKEENRKVWKSADVENLLAEIEDFNGVDGPVCALGGKLLFNAAQRNPQAVEAALASHPSEKAANYFSIWFRDLSENEKATVRKQAGRIKSPAVRDFFQNLTK